MPQKRSAAKPTPTMPLHQLANLSLLDELHSSELVVYIRIVAARWEQRAKRIAVTNAELFDAPRTAADAIRKLEKRGLIRVHYEMGTSNRTIEVV